MIRMTFDRARGGWTDAITGAAATAEERRRKARREMDVTSEAVLRRQLNHAFAGLARHESERPTVRIAVGAAPVRMVQRVERLDAELQLMAARQRHVLADAEIEVPGRRVRQKVARLDAKGPRRRTREGRRVEPGRRRRERTRVDVRVADQIPELIAAAGPDAGEVVVAAHRERRARLVLVHAGDLPVAERAPRPTGAPLGE